MKKWMIVVAGGSGLRMGADVPKQFLLLAGRPVLMQTLELLHRFDANMSLILVLPAEQTLLWTQLCIDHRFQVPCALTHGGHTRFHSVQNGLALVEEAGWVGVHDGVRPLVSLETLRHCFRDAESYGNAVPVIDAFESVRMVDQEGSRAMDRQLVKLVQTPQVFWSSHLKEAYARDFQDSFTDDASVVEEWGATIHLTQGNRENIKLTTPFDLEFARFLFSK